MVNAEFWRGRRVFVTGHTGFKGSWLVLWLHSMGAEVTGFSLPPPTEPSLFDVARVGDLVHTTTGDVRDFAALQDALNAARPEVVFHLAAQSLVRTSYADPVTTYATNVMGSVHLLESVRHCAGVRAVVMVTSDKCYENREWAWGYRENEAMGGHDPYSNSKGCSELVTSAYRSSFFTSADADPRFPAVASGRAGNVIGGGDWATDRLVPDFVRAILSGKELIIRSPHAIRPWQHVLEPLSGYLALAQRLLEGGRQHADGWNFGPHDQDAQPVAWVADRLVQLWGDGARWRLDSQIHPHEANYLKLDISKARLRLGWAPRWDLAQALGHLVAWYKAHARGEDMRAFTLGQIQAYSLTPAHN